jgi:hypothetical protein
MVFCILFGDSVPDRWGESVTTKAETARPIADMTAISASDRLVREIATGRQTSSRRRGFDIVPIRRDSDESRVASMKATTRTKEK